MDKYIVLPGKSDHQTRLLIDAYKFGFILRYPEGKEDIAWINYEPWHIRYLGKDAARNIAKDGITLEEYIKNKLYENVRREIK